MSKTQPERAQADPAPATSGDPAGPRLAYSAVPTVPPPPYPPPGYTPPPPAFGPATAPRHRADADLDEDPSDELIPGESITYDQFGHLFIRRILHKDRILRTVDQVMGPTIKLGPIGAGPGRGFASISVDGQFKPCKGEEIPGELLAYRIWLPIAVDFELDLRMDKHTFHADVVVPLTLTVHVEAPVRFRWEIGVPGPDEVSISLNTATRRGAMLQKIAGMEGELRRFLIKVVRTELSKPYVQKATNLDMEDLLDRTWDDITLHFLPQGPEDRQDPPAEPLSEA